LKPLTPEEKAKLAAWKAENIKKILIGKCMVEFLYEKKLITLDNEAHPNKKPVRTKDGYRTRTIVVANFTFDLSILPVRLMLPMVCPPRPWRSKLAEGVSPRHISDLTGGLGHAA
jgi:hypothetical protein